MNKVLERMDKELEEPGLEGEAHAHPASPHIQIS